MKRSRALISIAVAGALIASVGALAQVYPSPMQKWGVTSRSITTNYYFTDSERLAAGRAMATWNTVGPGFRFVAGGYSSYHPSGSQNNRPCDSQSGIGEAYDVSSSITAAEARVCHLNNVISDGDVWVNQGMLINGSFHAGTGNAPSNRYDFETVMLHEFGHLLRLLHDNNFGTTVVMHESISLGQTKRVLHSRDRTGKSTLYP